MKKLILLALMACFGFGARAQIQITDVFDNNLIIIGELSAGRALNALSSTSTNRLTEYSLYYRILKEEETIGILIDTENPLDDDVEFALGTTVEESDRSLELLREFLTQSDVKTSATIEDVQGRILQATKYTDKLLRIHSIDSHGKVIVDNCVYLNKRILNRATRLLLEEAEEKIKRAQRANNKK